MESSDTSLDASSPQSGWIDDTKTCCPTSIFSSSSSRVAAAFYVKFWDTDAAAAVAVATVDNKNGSSDENDGDKTYAICVRNMSAVKGRGDGR